MARTGRIKKDGDGHYHVMSRTNAKAFLFRSGRLKTKMVDLLQRSAAFSGVRLDAYAILDNHFHAGVTVLKPDEPIDEAEILKRVAILKGEKAAEAIAEHFASLRKEGLSLQLDGELDGWRRRMHDVSEFVKTFKELVNIHYKKENEHCGSIWSGRFTSTVVEGGKYWSVVRRYIELNAVRARIVSQSKDYAWCSHATTTSEPASTYIVLVGKVFKAGSVPSGDTHVGCEAGPVPGRDTPNDGPGCHLGTCHLGTCHLGTDPVWKSGETCAVGTDPAWEGRILRRVVQIGAGKIFGSLAFVEAMVGANARALPHGARARGILGDAFATHGWRLVAEEEKAA